MYIYALNRKAVGTFNPSPNLKKRISDWRIPLSNRRHPVLIMNIIDMLERNEDINDNSDIRLYLSEKDMDVEECFGIEYVDKATELDVMSMSKKKRKKLKAIYTDLYFSQEETKNHMSSLRGVLGIE